MYRPTEEQKAKAAERRQMFAEIIHKVSQMTDQQRSELAQRINVATIEGHTLSIHNQLLVALQCPNATLVGGFKQWRTQSRSVKKGEHGITIWIPKADKKNTEGDTPTPTDPEHPTFFMGTVFDIAQTIEIETA